MAALFLALALPCAASAQRWDEPAARTLAERATARRQMQIADTLLHDYKATARGFLTFLAQVGEGFPDPPKVVKADQLAVEVYWQAPDLSKQILVGRRDTLLLPGDVGYYRDRYGIVQNNFPDRIRLGDGNDVRDVPHPLSDVGLREYQFALGDSLRIRLPGREIEVWEVRFRPRDPSQPRAVGSLYVDRQTADVARMAITFTDAAILDRRIETLAVTLENGLVEGRFWLPRRQELEVARTSTWLDFPARGIIRGRWEVDDYEVNQGLPRTLFAGPEIVTRSRRELASYPFEGRILEQLPADVQAVTEADVERVREQAESLVRQQALARATGASLSARRVSDFVRVNRVEGLALGAGTVWRPWPRIVLAARGRYGFDDEQAKGRVSIERRRAGAGGVELFAERSYHEAGDAPERSLVLNSMAAQEFGSDHTDPYDVRAAGVGVSLGERFGARWRLEGAWERHRALEVHATPSAGRFEPTLPAVSLDGARISLGADRPTGTGMLGLGSLRWTAQLSAGLFEDAANEPVRFGRASVEVEGERALGAGRLVVRTIAAGVTGDAPAQSLALFGGPVTAPGYEFHSLAGRVGVSQRVEWQTAAPFLAIPLGRYGRAPATMTLAPYVHLAAIGGDVGGLPGRSERVDGVYPSIGVAGLFLFDLLRVDVARGLRDGRWMVGVDVTRTLWGIL
ncbi:MAG TPA: hypothetical protein VFX39_02720 [Gemmatimonadaceae bacterium]|nr:hypothetical protein [Gemmatimonadaceae bacterium]